MKRSPESIAKQKATIAENRKRYGTPFKRRDGATRRPARKKRRKLVRRPSLARVGPLEQYIQSAVAMAVKHELSRISISLTREE